MLIALGVLTVTSLLVGAVFVAVLGDVHTTQHDLDSKRAYYAASAGLNAYLYQLNQNPTYWSTFSGNASCANDTQAETPVPGSTTGEQYSYQPVYNSGYNASNCATSPTSALINTSTGTLEMEFTGYSGNPAVKRTIVTNLRKQSPLDFAWYTVYEALDSGISGYSGCNVFYRAGRNSACNINWVSGDVVNGPMYTQDQYLIYPGNTPTFGRNSGDKIESAAPGNSPGNICAGNSCGNAIIKGTPIPNAGTIPIPSTNQQLLTDATNHGEVYSGTTTIKLNGASATVTNCPSTSSSGSCTTSTVNFPNGTIFYVQNASGCATPTYTPFGATYPTNTGGNFYGCAGDVYVSGNYTEPVTVASANNIIVNGALTTSSSGGQLTGTATMGLVANQFIRVMHGVTARGSSEGQCTSGQQTASNIPSQTFSNLTIDAAILSLQHSFIVDNFDCGAQLGNLTVNGAIGQYFRGAVGTTAGTGYLKQYTYDDRLQLFLPPYLFDIALSGWHGVRETLCDSTVASPNPRAC